MSFAKRLPVRAEPWGDPFDPQAKTRWLPVVGGMRLTRGREPLFCATRAEALRTGRDVSRRISDGAGGPHDPR